VDSCQPSATLGRRTFLRGQPAPLVMPGERVQLGLRFVDYTGRYLVHCHNLEHENAGMMRNFLIS
jgi:FtsP/CotA-like multicopper oxidase with cupredoxin domain